MLLEHRGKRPLVPESAYVAPTAVLCGAVVLGERARVLHGAVLTAEDGEVRTGSDVVVMENALIRGRSGHPATLGDAVLIGPHAHVNGAVIEDEVFVATGASVFPGAYVGARSELRIARRPVGEAATARLPRHGVRGAARHVHAGDHVPPGGLLRGTPERPPNHAVATERTTGWWGSRWCTAHGMTR